MPFPRICINLSLYTTCQCFCCTNCKHIDGYIFFNGHIVFNSIVESVWFFTSLHSQLVLLYWLLLSFLKWKKLCQTYVILGTVCLLKIQCNFTLLFSKTGDGSYEYNKIFFFKESKLNASAFIKAVFLSYCLKLIRDSVGHIDTKQNTVSKTKKECCRDTIYCL